MFTVIKPRRGDLIAAFPLFERIKPLARPRLNHYSKTIYQPKENQKALLAEVSHLPSLEIAVPCIVDTFINLQGDITKTPVDQSIGDEDNCRKAILDALVHNKILADDRYVLGGENFKAFGQEDCCLIQIWTWDGFDSVTADIGAPALSRNCS